MPLTDYNPDSRGEEPREDPGGFTPENSAHTRVAADFRARPPEDRAGQALSQPTFKSIVNPQPQHRRSFLRPRVRHISTKLGVLLVAVLAAIMAAIGYLNIMVHKRHLQQSTLNAAGNISDVIKRSTAYYMLRDDREGLYEMMSTIADEPGVVRIRVISPDGRVNYSTEPREVETTIDVRSPECSACHSGKVVRAQLQASERFRIFRTGKERVLGTITPIENEPDCSNAACHAHPASQRILGVLDTEMSLARADASLAETTRTFAFLTLFGIAITTFLIWYAVRVVVHKPLAQLRAGTDRLASGELGFHLSVGSENDEVGLLAASFNTMSDQLLDARREITGWTHTLEERVEQKTAELRRAHDQMLKVERMVSIGKLAAVVAHEVNNPLAGILTYAKLLRKWTANGITTEEKRKEACDCLDLIASESKRCGDLVKNLLTFSRTSPINLEKTSLNAIVERCVKLVAHKAEVQSVVLISDTAADLPAVLCDGAQVEQVLLALIMNALDAMPRGGNLWVSSRMVGSEVELQVRDDGTGIPPELMNKIFEPFITTKEVGKGVGLGLAVAKGVVERHGGRIEVESELGVGTTFLVYLPLEAHLTEEPATMATAR